MKRYLFMLLSLLLLTACAAPSPANPEPASAPAPADASELTWDALTVQDSMDLQYADQFSVDYFQDGYKLITVAGTERYLVVPEGSPAPAGLPDGVAVLPQPLDAIYLAATSSMDLFRELGAVDRIRFSALDAGSWYIQEAKDALEQGEMQYAGKYSAPDYETIIDGGCDLAIESTMIYHDPEVQEQLERFGIPVLVERSSYEAHPLGRMEWVRLYAALLNLEEKGDAFFRDQLDRLTPILDQPETGKTVAFFYVTSNGTVNVRKSGDYIAKSIALAGGRYAFDGLADETGNALSTMVMQMEAFYDGAKDADVLIYNSSIDAELTTIDQLLDKSGVLADFKAVQNGHVWCTGKNLFQESLGLGDFIADLHQILNSPDPENLSLTYLHRLT